MTQEVMELFNALESNRPRDVEAIKAEFSAMLGSVRDPWLVHGLVNYHVRTGSVRAVEVLVRAPEFHARHLFDKLAEGVRADWRASALALLGHVVRRQPLWLHQIAQHPLLSQLLKLLRTERDIPTLMSGLLALITLLPMIPVLVGKYFQEIFEVFKRLAAWDNAHADDRTEAGRREHLQLGLYALFYNLYGMYPCNFIDFLRREYGRESGERERREIFNHTIKPMLDTVRLHPLLITASKVHETQGARWQKMEHHDILEECRRFSLEGSERLRAIETDESRFRSRCGTDVASLATNAAAHHMDSGKASTSAPNLTEAQTHTKTTLTTSRIDPNSIVYLSATCDAVEPGADRWFSLSDACASGAAPSAPHTPLPLQSGAYGELPAPRTPLAHLHVAVLDGGSPPEAAIEATPENTPIKDLGGRRFNFPNNSSTVRAIGGGLQRLPSHVVPSQSQPPSPLKKEPSPFGRTSEADGQDGRKDRLTRVVLERAQAETYVGKQSSGGGGSPHKKPYPYQSHVGSSVPNSPIPIGTGAPASGSTDWPLAKPKPKKDGVMLEASLRDYKEDSNKEDREVTELTMRSPGAGAVRDESRTPADTPGRGYSEPYAEEWGEDELACDSEEHCRERNHGLHMPPSSSMIDFAKKVANRIRFYSQCVPDPSCGSFPKSASDARDSLGREGKLVKVASCPDFRKSKCKTSEAHTQTVDTWPAAYEFLLSNMFQGLCERPAARRRPDLALAADSERGGGTLALYEQIDRYIETLVRGGGGGTGGGGGGGNDKYKVERLTEQLQLTHALLLFERHRKDVHAMRNRRLLGKCRKNRATEEQNLELTDRLKSLQAENEELRAQINKQNVYAQSLETTARQSSLAAHDKQVALEAELADEQRAREKLADEFEGLRRRAADESADMQHLLAVKFDLTQRLERALRSSETSERLVEYVRAMQRELLMCGEREARIADAVASSPLVNHTYLAKLLRQYKEELCAAQDALHATSSRLEGSQAREAELEAAVTNKEAVIHEIKKHKRLVKDEYEARTAALEDKYACLLNINQKLECRVLELLRFAPGGGGVGAAGAAGGGGSGTGSAASPHSSPLSASLASSEGPLAAHVALSDVTHLHHLLERPGGDAGPAHAPHNNTDREPL